MSFLVPIVLCGAAGVAAVIWELRGRVPGASTRGRGHHAGLAFLLGAMALVAASPQVALVFEHPLPIEPPADPHAEGCGDDSAGGGLIVVLALAIYFGGRLGPALLAAIVRAAAGPPRYVLTGKGAQTVAAIFLGVVFPVVTLRLVVPGPAPADVTTYGALTPDAGLRGWRLDHTLDAMRAGPLESIPILRESVSDLSEGSHGHGSFSSGPYLKPGVHGWVGGEPVLIFEQDGWLVGAMVSGRDEADVPAARRPRFDSWPLAARRAGDDGWLLVERRRDGSTFAMKLYAYAQAEQVDARDVWLLVRPSELAHGGAFALFLLGLALARAAHRRGDAPGLALLSAWIWLEAGALDLYYYAPYLGL